MHRIVYSLCLVCCMLCITLFISCEKEPDAPTNPYSGINYNTDTTKVTNPDPASIVGLHKNIFYPKCAAQLGCHDGTFEPDFRTVQSTYSTMVYHTVIKPTVDNVHYFQLRVKPFAPDTSFLIERLTTTTSDYMPSNGNRLSTQEIGYIRTWIQNGAKDENGKIPAEPDLPPYDSAFIYFVIDSTKLPGITPIDIVNTRLNGIPYNPFVVPAGTKMGIIFNIKDDKTPPQNWTVNQLKLSLKKNVDSAVVTRNAIYFPAPYNVWVAFVNTSAYPSGTQVYFRYYVNDGKHAQPTETPRNDLPDIYKSYFSFYVQ